jgi:ketosteroid isomerase-like protein
MSTTTAEGGLATVRRFYDLVGEGRVEDATALMHDELVIHEPAELPFGGEYHGPAGFGDIMQRIVRLAEPEVPGPIEYFETAGGPVVVRFTGRFSSRRSGRSVDVEIVELFTVRDGKIVDLDIYYKTPGAVAALLAT